MWDGGDSLVVLGGTVAAGMDSALAAYSLSRREWFAPLVQVGPPPAGTPSPSPASLALLLRCASDTGTLSSEAPAARAGEAHPRTPR